MTQRGRIHDMAFSVIQTELSIDDGIGGFNSAINSRLREGLWVHLLPLIEGPRVCVYWELRGSP